MQMPQNRLSNFWHLQTCLKFMFNVTIGPRFIPELESSRP